MKSTFATPRVPSAVPKPIVYSLTLGDLSESDRILVLNPGMLASRVGVLLTPPIVLNQAKTAAMA